MNTKMIRLAAATLLATGVSAAAHAEYRCDPAPSWADRVACEAAAQGPTELRRTVWAMNAIRINLRFEDYVNDETVQKWAAADSPSHIADVEDTIDVNDAAVKVASLQR